MDHQILLLILDKLGFFDMNLSLLHALAVSGQKVSAGLTIDAGRTTLQG